MGRWQAEEGAVSAMVAVLALGLVACAGLAYDGGMIVTTTAAAHDVAAAGARAGAQQVDPAAVHQGMATLDPAAATAAAEAFVAEAGMTATAAVQGSAVTVAVRTTQPMRILPLADRMIVATATATAVSDVLGGAP